jgi:methylated-DNA-[protein]-cysteine S-methyltransferase
MPSIISSPSRLDYQAIVAAPFFALGLRCNDEFILGLDFLPRMPAQPPSPQHALGARAARQLQDWLAQPDWRFDLPLSPQGTPFQQRVWRQISAIPYGQTRNYGQLSAALASSPRAVGGACGANPLPVFVPCHRVIAKDGGLGGFNRDREGWLLDIKRWLIAREQGVLESALEPALAPALEPAGG